MLAYCEATSNNQLHRATSSTVPWDTICQLANTEAFFKTKLRWESNDQGDYHSLGGGDSMFSDGALMPNAYYSNFFHRLFTRHRKYSDRGITFEDEIAHRQFMNAKTYCNTIDPVDIGHFDTHEGAPGSELFMDFPALSQDVKSALSQDDACSLITLLGADPDLEVSAPPFVSCHLALTLTPAPATLKQAPFKVIYPSQEALQLTKGGRQKLVDLVEEAYAAGGSLDADFKLSITRSTLEELVDAGVAGRLLSNFAPDFFCSPQNVVKIRRCAAHGHCIEPHLDKHSLRTMQVTLNGDEEYRGGRLVYVTKAGLQCPSRPAGTVTIHDSSVVHGVTKMERGVRYGLFFLVK
jgi:hypothetical protein